MSLLQMSFSGAVMILFIVIIRALAINRLPKDTFLVLWGVALVRLLVPYTLPSAFSIYSLTDRLIPASAAGEKLPVPRVIPALPAAETVPQTAPALSVSGTPAFTIDLWTAVWLIGTAACAAFFAAAYRKCRREFKASLPVDNDYARRWLADHPLRRTIDIRQSGRISAPLTYGVFRPVILMPGTTDWSDHNSLKYVLAHEYVHICRFDAATKLILTAALCVHWFNPAVWIMYILANRDLELSCDEAVVRRFGERTKSDYALTLIRMEETRSGLTPLCNSFSKSAIEERIIAIMKQKKTSTVAALAAAALIVCVTTGFATSGQATGTEQVAGDAYASSATGILTHIDPNTGKAYLSYDGGVTYTKENDILSYVDSSDGKTYYSFDEGKTWESMTDEEFDALTLADQPGLTIEWWTAEDYAAWLEEEKAALQSIIGERGWTPSTGWFTWDQQMVDETIALHEQTLKDIQNGLKVSKPTVDGDMMVMFGYEPSAVETVTGTKSEIFGTSKQDFSQDELAEYAPFGLIYDAEKGFTFHGKPVRYFEDSVRISENTATVHQYWNEKGTVDIHTVREAAANADGSADPFGRLIGIEEYKPGELDVSGLTLGAAEAVASAAGDSAENWGSVSISDELVAENTVAWGSVSFGDGSAAGESTHIADGGNDDANRDFIDAMARYAPFGVTFVKEDPFGNVYYNGELVDVLIDRSPDGSYRSVRSTNRSSSLKIQAIYDAAGRLAGFKPVKG